MNRKPNRLFYLLMIFIVIGLGLLSRKMSNYIPDIIDLFLGDSLWALMVYLFIRMLFKNWSTNKVVLTGILFCFVIEFSQLYHDEWIDIIRRTTLGGLILGYGFLWSDLDAYLLGIGFGIIIDGIIEKYFI
jgi:glycopeptide antibiotics resistance protein